jgi:thiamine-monophosphate kinase
MFESKQRTEISSLGEFGLINRIKENFPILNKTTLLGIGDDAAILKSTKKDILISTDLLLEGIHFDLSYVPLKHLGYKSVMVNLSDIFAMNAIPEQITVSLGFSNRFSLEAIDELYEGIALACNKYKIDLIGGDTSSSQKGLVISITSVGYQDNDKIVRRSGANKNDLLCVTGDLGAAYLGLQILEREKSIYLENPAIQPDFENKDYLIERQLKPEARGDIIELLNKKNILPTSMIDISDGLSSEILHICKASDKGCRIFEDKLPIDSLTVSTAHEFNLDPTVCALSGGEDYELLFTIPIHHYETIKNMEEITIIGHILSKDEGSCLISKGNNQYDIIAQGWTNFK